MNLYDRLPVGCFTVNEEGLVLDVNQCAVSMLGTRTGPLIGQPVFKFIHADHRSGVSDLIAEALKGDAPTELDARLETPGAERWVSVRAAKCDEKTRPSLHLALVDVTVRKQREEAHRTSLDQMRGRQKAITDASLSDAFIAGEVVQLAREITERAAGVVGVERANVWLFNPEETELRCIDLFEASSGRHSSGAVLTAAEYGPEFLALKSARFVDAADPIHDPRTRGYAEGYLKPLNITSMLDAVIEVSGHRLGVLCLEHVGGPPHHWEPDEVDFACQLADKVALSLVNRARRDAQETLRASEARYRRLFESARDGLLILDAEDGTVLDVNPFLADLIGDPRESIVGRTVFELPLLQKAIPDFGAFSAIRAQGFVSYEDITLETRTGRRVAAEFVSITYMVNHKTVVQCQIRDVTSRKQADEQLRKFSRIVEQAPLSIAITNLKGVLEYVNPRFTEVAGYTREEVLGQNPRMLQSGGTSREVYADLWQTITSGGVWRGEFENQKKDGEVYYELAVIAPVVGSDGHATHFVALKEDITQRKRDEDALERSLSEKEALLREVHHRVKNNLQVITSLLRLEGGRAEHQSVRSVLKEMQGRILSMALLHETLYRSGDFGHVALAGYLQQLSQQLFRAQNTGAASVELILDLEPVQIQIDQAIPCGLMVNEMLTNALKHGFPNGRSGEVRVILRPVGEDLIRLEVRDNGIGLPADFETRQTRSLGFQLIVDLARQLGGRLEMGAGPGAVLGVQFPRVKPHNTGPTYRPTSEISRP